MKSLYTATIASTEEERVAAYRLRYSVYIEEQKKQYSEADHERRWLTDRLDASSAIVLGKNSAVLCGTVRASFLDSEVVKQTYEEQLGLSLFARVEPKAVAICSRLAVLRSDRATPVSSVIFSELYRYGSERGIQLCFVACASGLRSFFLQYGFREYLAPFPDHVVGTLHRMVLALDDLVHLERTNSPYLPTAKLLRMENVSRPWLEDILEEQRKPDAPSAALLLPDRRIVKRGPKDGLVQDYALIEKTESHYQKSSVIKEICAIRFDADSNRLHAVVVPDFEKLKVKRVVNVGEVIRFDIDTLSAELRPVNRISSYDIWQQELPKNSEGQLDRAKIRRQVEEHRSETSADRGTTSKRELKAEEVAWLSDPYVRRVLHVIQTSTNTKNRIRLPDDNIEFDLKLDSLGRVELLAALESELGVHMHQEKAAAAYTLRDLVDAVRHGEYVEKTESGWKALFSDEAPTEYVREFSRERRLLRIFWFAVGFWRTELGADRSDPSEAEWERGLSLYHDFDVEAAVSDIAATMAVARTLSGASGKVGAVGYCRGRLMAFLAAASRGADAAVAYYGGGADSGVGGTGKIPPPLLMHLAEDGGFIPAEAQRAILAALKGHPQIEIHTYPGCCHAFARTGGKHYDAAAAEKANARTVAFFRILR